MDQGAWWALPVANYMPVPRDILEGSGPSFGPCGSGDLAGPADGLLNTGARGHFGELRSGRDQVEMMGSWCGAKQKSRTQTCVLCVDQ